jgi:hypothetical protein
MAFGDFWIGEGYDWHKHYNGRQRKKKVQEILAYSICIVAAICFAWDFFDLVGTRGQNTVSEYIRDSWLRWPAGFGIGALVASHFFRWPFE